MILYSYFSSKLKSQGHSSVTPTSFDLSWWGDALTPCLCRRHILSPFQIIFGSVCFSRHKWCRTPTNLLPAFVFSGKTRNFCAHDSSINHDRGGGKRGEVKFLPWDWQRTRGENMRGKREEEGGARFFERKIRETMSFLSFPPFCRKQFNVRKSGKERRTFSPTSTKLRIFFRKRVTPFRKSPRHALSSFFFTPPSILARRKCGVGEDMFWALLLPFFSFGRRERDVNCHLLPRSKNGRSFFEHTPWNCSRTDSFFFSKSCRLKGYFLERRS